VAPWSEHVQVHWAEETEAYVTPVAADCVNVALLSSRRAPFADQLTAFPALREHLGDDTFDRPCAAGPLLCRVARRVAGRVLLVGDAAGYVDALTGEGLSVAFACATAAAKRLAEDQPDRYAGDYARISRRYRLITCALLTATGSRTIRRAIVPAAQHAPGLFRAAVAQLASESHRPHP
jgi:flavin-dependent dehydrogenase